METEEGLFVRYCDDPDCQKCQAYQLQATLDENKKLRHENEMLRAALEDLAGISPDETALNLRGI